MRKPRLLHLLDFVQVKGQTIANWILGMVYFLKWYILYIATLLIKLATDFSLQIYLVSIRRQMLVFLLGLNEDSFVFFKKTVKCFDNQFYEFVLSEIHCNRADII